MKGTSLGPKLMARKNTLNVSNKKDTKPKGDNDTIINIDLNNNEQTEP
jgi:hypothetical protein